MAGRSAWHATRSPRMQNSAPTNGARTVIVNASRQYELLARDLAERLSSAAGAVTEQCRHDVRLAAGNTINQIDVYWVGLINGHRHRVLIECKHYNRRLVQEKVHSLRSVVRDSMAEDGIPTTGVLVTPVGYQRGAKNLAEVNENIVLLALRPPTREDVAGRVLGFDYTIELGPSLSPSSCSAGPSNRPPANGRPRWLISRCSIRRGEVHL